MDVRMDAKTILVLTILVEALCYGTSDEAYGRFMLFTALGIVLYDCSTFYKYARKYWKIIGALAFALNVIGAYFLILMKDIDCFTFEYLFMRFVWALACVLSVIAFIGLGQEKLNVSGKITRFLVKRSFGIYFIHMSVLVTVGHWVIAYGKFDLIEEIILILGLSFILTLLVVETVAIIPFINSLLGIKKKRR